MGLFGALAEAPLHRRTYFNSRLRKSASLEDTFLTKWCSRLSAVLILTNDSFQNIGFGLVCVTPTAQNGVFMLFMFVVQHVQSSASSSISASASSSDLASALIFAIDSASASALAAGASASASVSASASAAGRASASASASASY